MPLSGTRSLLACRYAFSRPLLSDVFLFGLNKSSNSSLAASKPLSRCFSSTSAPVNASCLPLSSSEAWISSKRQMLTSSPTAWKGLMYSLSRFKSSSIAIPAVSEQQIAEIPSQKGSADGKPAISPGDKVKESLKDAEKSNVVTVSNYWGITPDTVLREDGTPWPWRSFKPGDAYSSNTKIDLTRHHIPDTIIDKAAFWTVKALRLPTDVFFQKRYGCRAMMLETVAAVPGMVGGMLLHLRSIRRFEHSGGWIKALLEEAENERMHLMTFMEVAKPRWYERALVFTVQGVFFNAYFMLYIASPRLAHRITGYLEEEAIYSYTEYLKEIDNGHLPNIPAPAIAIDYWRLPKDATIRDVVEVVRADEAHHRDVNHFAADVHEDGKELRKAPAPLGYH